MGTWHGAFGGGEKGAPLILGKVSSAPVISGQGRVPRAGALETLLLIFWFQVRRDRISWRGVAGRCAACSPASAGGGSADLVGEADGGSIAGLGEGRRWS